MADMGIAIMAEEYAKQRAREVKQQEEIDSVVQQNCLQAINQVEAQIVRENPDISRIVQLYPSVEDDPQTRRFLDFVSFATNFSSIKFTERLRNVPELITSIKQLLIEMIKEIKDFANTARELQDLIHCFIKLVVNTKRNMELVISPLQESINHMEIIADALSINATMPLENRDKEDIKIALKGMSGGIEKLLLLAQTAKKESNDLDEKIAVMKGNILEKKVVVQGRLELAKCAPWLGVGVGGIGGFAAAGAVVNAEVLGGVGALVIQGMAFPPVFAIIAAALIGGVAVAGIVYLVQRLWATHNTKALDYLNRIFDLLVKLSDANLYFSSYMNRAEVGASKILNETSQIQRTITSGSERYRKLNERICTDAITSTHEMIKSINDIVNIDMSEWSSSSAVLNYASSSAGASATRAIKN